MGIVESTYAELKQQELKNNPYSCLHMADIDINPHQIEAFTFALSSLELGGAILADEVGLGKTIEAGLVIKYLLDIYGLVQFIDDRVFYSKQVFSERYLRGEDYNDLKVCLEPVVQRTLRKEVAEYIQFSERKEMTIDFELSPMEIELYVMINNYLKKEILYALPNSHRTLITSVIRKLLASSSMAVAETFKVLKGRLETLKETTRTESADEPLLVKNKVLPVYQINPSYTWDMVCEAICKIEGFTYEPYGEFQGHSSENRFIHITEEFVNTKYVMSIMKNLGDKQSLLIYCKKNQADMILPENVEVKKIPKDLLDKCNFESEVQE